MTTKKKTTKKNVMKATKTAAEALSDQKIAKAREVLAEQRKGDQAKCEAIIQKAQKDIAALGYEITPYIRANGTGVIESGFTFIDIRR